MTPAFSHSALLEKEMGAALVELQALVQEGRTYIAKEVGTNQAPD